ncbi:hypothetical protein A7N09_19045 [Acinetobacter baumannii]|nr:hypothetical protein A7N09_19045 [Acinetobacter baumannii]
MNTYFNGLELRLLRQLNHLSLEDLSTHVGKSRQFLHKIEMNQVAPTSDLIGVLSNFFNVKTEIFFSSHPILQEEQINFRSNKTAKVFTKQSVIAQGEYLKRLVEFIEANLRLPRYSIPSVDHVQNFQDIENAALQFRKHFNLGLGPISDMTKLCEMLGIFVTTFPSVSNEVDALSIASKRPIFVNNEDSSTCRQRFNLAHELGHLVLHDGCVTGDSLTESQAHRFASALLIPQEMMNSHFRYCFNGRFNWNKLSKMKMDWKISKAALLYRAKSLGLIDDVSYRSGYIHLKRTGEALLETEDKDIPREIPHLLENCFKALNKKRISAESIANELNISLDLLNKITQLNHQKPNTSKLLFVI